MLDPSVAPDLGMFSRDDVGRLTSARIAFQRSCLPSHLVCASTFTRPSVMPNVVCQVSIGFSFRVARMTNKKHKPPKPSCGDLGHTTTKAAWSLSPVAGPAVVEFLSYFFQPPIEKRMQEWMGLIADGLRQLEEKAAVDLEKLQQNEQFVSTAMQAFPMSLRNHQKEKLEALRNAVLNSALPSPPDESLQQMFLHLVSTFTVWHLRLLGLMNDPAGWFSKHRRQFPALMTGTLSRVIESAFSELQGKREFYDQVYKGLLDAGLVNTPSLHSVTSADGMKRSRTTDLGKQFLRFITDPPQIAASLHE